MEPAGGPRRDAFSIREIIWGDRCLMVTIPGAPGGGAGPPPLAAPGGGGGVSSLIALASLGLSAYAGTPYGVFGSACSDLRFGSFLWYIRLTAFLVCCWAAFCALSFAVVFSVVGSLLYFRLSLVCFVGDVLYCLCGCIPFGDALGIL